MSHQAVHQQTLQYLVSSCVQLQPKRMDFGRQKAPTRCGAAYPHHPSCWLENSPFQACNGGLHVAGNFLQGPGLPGGKRLSVLRRGAVTGRGVLVRAHTRTVRTSWCR